MRPLIAVAFVVLSAASSHAATLAHWRFEEGGGTTVGDVSGNGHTGTFFNAPAFTSDRPQRCLPNGQALAFERASQDAVTIPDAPGLRPANQITVEAWIKLASADWSSVVAKQFDDPTHHKDSFQIEVNNPNPSTRIRFQLTDDLGGDFFVSTSVAPPVGEWVHVAGTWDGVTMRLYLGFELMAEAPFEGVIGYDSGPVMIGADDDTGPPRAPESGFFPGSIDEVRISDVALTPDQMVCNGTLRMARATFGSAGGTLDHAGGRMAITAGQSVTGMAAGPPGASPKTYAENVGFWLWGRLPVLDVPDVPRAESRVPTLEPCAPNPFSSRTRIRFTVPSAGHVSVRIYDVLGRLVRVVGSGVRVPGVHDLTWDGRNDSGETVRDGIYFCRMSASGFQATARLALIR